MTDVEYEGRRLSFAAAGGALTLHAHCVFIGTERIHLGSHVMVSEFTWINAGVATHVGSFVHLANHASIAGGGVCIAEDFAGLSAGAGSSRERSSCTAKGSRIPPFPPRSAPCAARSSISNGTSLSERTRSSIPA
jgi:hypothetical protein